VQQQATIRQHAAIATFKSLIERVTAPMRAGVQHKLTITSATQRARATGRVIVRGALR